tara:strand:- start:6 stop:146 length:141 start_codon:yes stop_codon:yes gene_type:complete
MRKATVRKRIYFSAARLTRSHMWQRRGPTPDAAAGLQMLRLQNNDD